MVHVVHGNILVQVLKPGLRWFMYDRIKLAVLLRRPLIKAIRTDINMFALAGEYQIPLLLRTETFMNLFGGVGIQKIWNVDSPRLREEPVIGLGPSG